MGARPRPKQDRLETLIKNVLRRVEAQKRRKLEGQDWDHHRQQIYPEETVRTQCKTPHGAQQPSQEAHSGRSLPTRPLAHRLPPKDHYRRKKNSPQMPFQARRSMLRLTMGRNGTTG